MPKKIFLRQAEKMVRQAKRCAKKIPPLKTIIENIERDVKKAKRKKEEKSPLTEKERKKILHLKQVYRRLVTEIRNLPTNSHQREIKLKKLARLARAMHKIALKAYQRK